MATVICKTCNSTFESKMHPATTAGATAAGAAGADLKAKGFDGFKISLVLNTTECEVRQLRSNQ